MGQNKRLSENEVKQAKLSKRLIILKVYGKMLYLQITGNLVSSSPHQPCISKQKILHILVRIIFHLWSHWIY